MGRRKAPVRSSSSVALDSSSRSRRAFRQWLWAAWICWRGADRRAEAKVVPTSRTGDEKFYWCPVTLISFSRTPGLGVSFLAGLFACLLANRLSDRHFFLFSLPCVLLKYPRKSGVFGAV